MPSFLLIPTTLVILRKPVKDVSLTSLLRFAARAQTAVRLRGEVTVLVTGNRELQKLNREFRSKNQPTDVISFPAEAHGIAGDIAISADIARSNGQELGHGTLTELKILILHGMLHLAGLDHEADNGEMARKETRLRRQLGLPAGLIERVNGSRAAPSTKEKTR